MKRVALFALFLAMGQSSLAQWSVMPITNNTLVIETNTVAISNAYTELIGALDERLLAIGQSAFEYKDTITYQTTNMGTNFTSEVLTNEFTNFGGGYLPLGMTEAMQDKIGTIISSYLNHTLADTNELYDEWFEDNTNAPPHAWTTTGLFVNAGIGYASTNIAAWLHLPERVDRKIILGELSFIGTNGGYTNFISQSGNRIITSTNGWRFVDRDVFPQPFTNDESQVLISYHAGSTNPTPQNGGQDIQIRGRIYHGGQWGEGHSIFTVHADYETNHYPSAPFPFRYYDVSNLVSRDENGYTGDTFVVFRTNNTTYGHLDAPAVGFVLVEHLNEMYEALNSLVWTLSTSNYWSTNGLALNRKDGGSIQTINPTTNGTWADAKSEAESIWTTNVTEGGPAAPKSWSLQRTRNLSEIPLTTNLVAVLDSLSSSPSAEKPPPASNITAAADFYVIADILPVNLGGPTLFNNEKDGYGGVLRSNLYTFVATATASNLSASALPVGDLAAFTPWPGTDSLTLGYEESSGFAASATPIAVFRWDADETNGFRYVAP
jgi:hypothetical protein